MSNALRHTRWRKRHLTPLSGKLAVVTGANSGIGFAAAAGLLDLGAEVILACRNPTRAQKACEQLKERFPSAAVNTAMLDLSSLASIEAFSKDLAERGRKIDIFLHCAGVYYPNVPRTAEGLPTTVGVNFFGTTRLAEAVLSLMGSESKMIFTTSLVDRFGRIRGENVFAPDKTEGYAAYSRSKLLLSAYTLRRASSRAEGEPAFIAVHPGITATSLLSPEKTTHKPLFSRMGHAFLYLFTHSPEKAALTALLAACCGENGDCIGPRGLFGISGFPHRTRFCRNVRRGSLTLFDQKSQKNPE
ncbi:MAG: SDR family NAD(P)-dependent oxidoreductase [Ruminococcaceae bacterium]|nr:SDR family NAD(P)-dependent oxidoreductase [Oscillospiraceae bacterium]